VKFALCINIYVIILGLTDWVPFPLNSAIYAYSWVSFFAVFAETFRTLVP